MCKRLLIFVAVILLLSSVGFAAIGDAQNYTAVVSDGLPVNGSIGLATGANIGMVSHGPIVSGIPPLAPYYIGPPFDFPDIPRGPVPPRLDLEPLPPPLPPRWWDERLRIPDLPEIPDLPPGFDLPPRLDLPPLIPPYQPPLIPP